MQIKIKVEVPDFLTFFSLVVLAGLVNDPHHHHYEGKAEQAIVIKLSFSTSCYARSSLFNIARL